MTRPSKTLRSLSRAVALLVTLCVPMSLAVNAGTGASGTIEAPAQPNKGVGLFLLVTLQRA